MKYYDNSKVQVGDIIQYKPLPFKFRNGFMYNLNVCISWLICLFTFSKYAHTSMITEIDAYKRIFITEALVDTGVTKKQLNEKWYPRISVLRPAHTKVVQNELAAKWWESKIGCDYDMTACLLTGFKGLFLLFRRRQLHFDTSGKFFCSNGVACAYLFAGIKISNVHPSQCEPRDINRPSKYCSVVDIVCKER